MSVTTQYGVLGGKVVADTNANATGVDNVTSASGSIFYCEIDNTANSTAIYLKWYNSASPTIGVTEPNIVFRVGAGESQYFNMPQGIAFGTAFSYACTTAGGTAGDTSPTHAVSIKAIIS